MDQSRFSWPLFSLSRALTAVNLDPPAGRAGVINLEVDGMNTWGHAGTAM